MPSPRLAGTRCHRSGSSLGAKILRAAVARRPALSAACLALLIALFGVAGSLGCSGDPATPQEAFDEVVAAMNAGRPGVVWDLMSKDGKDEWVFEINGTRDTVRRNPGAVKLVDPFQVTVQEFLTLPHAELFSRAHARMEKVLVGLKVIDTAVDPETGRDVDITFETSAGQQFRFTFRQDPGRGWRFLRGSPIKLEVQRGAGEPGEAVMPRMRLRAPLCSLLFAAACGGGRDTPELMFETVRAAVSTRDPRLFYATHDTEARALARQTARDWRARLEEGEPKETVLADAGGMSESDIKDGTIDEAAARVLLRHSPLGGRTKWYESAVVVPPPVPDGTSAMKLRLRGTDGREDELWLVLEREGWAIDARRTWMSK